MDTALPHKYRNGSPTHERTACIHNLYGLSNYAFTKSFKALPALNFGALEAGIGITAPV